MRMDETRRRGGEGDIYDGTGMVDSEVNENDFIVLVSRLRSATLSDRKRGGRRWGKRIAIPPRDLQKSVRYKGLGGGGERVEKERKILCILETRSRAVADFSKKIFRI